MVLVDPSIVGADLAKVGLGCPQGSTLWAQLQGGKDVKVMGDTTCCTTLHDLLHVQVS